MGRSACRDLASEFEGGGWARETERPRLFPAVSGEGMPGREGNERFEALLAADTALKLSSRGERGSCMNAVLAAMLFVGVSSSSIITQPLGLRNDDLSCPIGVVCVVSCS